MFPQSLGEVTISEYNDISEVAAWLTAHSHDIQCVVSHITTLDEHLPFGRIIPFGRGQYPSLDDYADGVDTMAFLTN